MDRQGSPWLVIFKLPAKNILQVTFCDQHHLTGERTCEYKQNGKQTYLCKKFTHLPVGLISQWPDGNVIPDQKQSLALRGTVTGQIHFSEPQFSRLQNGDKNNRRPGLFSTLADLSLTAPCTLRYAARGKLLEGCRKELQAALHTGLGSEPGSSVAAALAGAAASWASLLLLESLLLPSSSSPRARSYLLIPNLSPSINQIPCL